MSWGALAVGLASVLASSHHGSAAATDEEALAQRHAPVIAVQEHTEECGDGEPFAPAAVESVLGQDGVVLRDANGDVLVDRPTAADLFSAPVRTPRTTRPIVGSGRARRPDSGVTTLVAPAPASTQRS